MESFFSNSVLVLEILSAVSIVGFVLMIVLFIQLRQLTKKYKAFTSLTDAVDIESVLIGNQDQIKSIQQHLNTQDQHIDAIYENLKLTFEKIGIVKYNAFDGMGGQMSAVVVLMNKNLDGVLFNAIHTREGSHVYTKAINNGKTEQALSKEEETAIKKAMMDA